MSVEQMALIRWVDAGSLLAQNGWTVIYFESAEGRQRRGFRCTAIRGKNGSSRGRKMCL